MHLQVQCVMYTVQCVGCSVMPAKDKDLAVEITFKNKEPWSILLKRFETNLFLKPKKKNKILF